ncbi:MAG: hypothetical protein ABI867_33575 [Kofleriaceae bacterium]
MKIALAFALVLAACGSKKSAPVTPAEPAPVVEPAVVAAPENKLEAPPVTEAKLEPAPAMPVAVVAFGTVPEGWSMDDSATAMSLVVAVNQSKFPVDNAVFAVEFGLEEDATPKDAKAYAAWLGTTKSFKVTKTTAAPAGKYYESKDAFRYALEVDGKRVWCGGSLYKTADYNKIPKDRDAAVTSAKKLCASVKPA